MNGADRVTALFSYYESGVLLFAFVVVAGIFIIRLTSFLRTQRNDDSRLLWKTVIVESATSGFMMVVVILILFLVKVMVAWVSSLFDMVTR